MSPSIGSSSSLDEPNEEASLSVSRFLLQVLPLLPVSLDGENNSTEPYGENHVIKAHRALHDADINKSVSLGEEIDRDGKTSVFKANTNAQLTLN